MPVFLGILRGAVLQHLVQKRSLLIQNQSESRIVVRNIFLAEGVVIEFLRLQPFQEIPLLNPVVPCPVVELLIIARHFRDELVFREPVRDAIHFAVLQPQGIKVLCSDRVNIWSLRILIGVLHEIEDRVGHEHHAGRLVGIIIILSHLLIDFKAMPRNPGQLETNLAHQPVILPLRQRHPGRVHINQPP